MGIVANNSFRFNYCMDLWEMKNFTAEDLLDNWSTIYGYASAHETEDDVYFLADCLDIINEKILSLSETEKKSVLAKVMSDVRSAAIGENVLRIAG